MLKSATLALAIVMMSTHAIQVSAEDGLGISFKEVRVALAKVPISEGPNEGMKTRSAWGPELYKKTVDATILILVVDRDSNGEPTIVGSGSGVVVSESGLALTNWHVTWPRKMVIAVTYPGTGKTYEEIGEDGIWYAKVLTVDQRADLALLQIGKTIANKGVARLKGNYISLEDPSLLEVGQDVFAIGHPEGLHWTYTEGVISQIRPRYAWQMEKDSFRATVIQTQTAISYGSSGGPLINRSGRLVGIVSNMMPDRPGFNFAISVHELRTFLTQYASSRQ